MIEITAEAVEQLKKFQQTGSSDLPVRVAIMSGAANRSNIGVMMDDKNANDLEMEFDGLLVIIDSNLMDYCQQIDIDYVQVAGEGCSAGGGVKITAKVSL